MRRPEGPALPNVEEICSLGHYHGGGPKNWVDQWRHNEMWLYDSEEIALAVIADAIDIHIEQDSQRNLPWRVGLTRERGTGFDLYAYKLFPVRFTEGQQEVLELPRLEVTPLPNDYRRLGYDAVNKTCCAHFECSPLFCNGMAVEIPVNRYCLIDEPERAFEVGRYFSVRKPEPGSYFVVEVWRKCKPFAAPKRSGEPFEWPGSGMR